MPFYVTGPLEIFRFTLAVKNWESGHHAFVVNNTTRLHIVLKKHCLFYFHSRQLISDILDTVLFRIKDALFR